jgi:FkbM family methyltransferase
MMIPAEQVIAAFKAHNISIEGVLHIGAHDCEELSFYGQLGVDTSSVYWIDALEFKVLQAQQRGIPNVYQAVVTDKDEDNVVFHVSNNIQSSSVLEFGTHLKHHRGIDFIHHIPLKTTTVDTFLEKHSIDPTRLHFWNFDIQGAELLALKGATKALAFAKALYLEVNTEEVYKGCGQMHELDAFLSGYGFTRILTNVTGAGWGDALYVRA